jgi:hypothetical protein
MSALIEVGGWRFEVGGKGFADGGERLEIEPAAVGGLRLEVGGGIFEFGLFSGETNLLFCYYNK